jgi:hypothetical protein
MVTDRLGTEIVEGSTVICIDNDGVSARLVVGNTYHVLGTSEVGSIDVDAPLGEGVMAYRFVIASGIDEVLYKMNSALSVKNRALQDLSLRMGYLKMDIERAMMKAYRDIE